MRKWIIGFILVATALLMGSLFLTPCTRLSALETEVCWELQNLAELLAPEPFSLRFIAVPVAMLGMFALALAMRARRLAELSLVVLCLAASLATTRAAVDFGYGLIGMFAGWRDVGFAFLYGLLMIPAALLNGYLAIALWRVLARRRSAADQATSQPHSTARMTGDRPQ
jgi:hypothetical protein